MKREKNIRESEAGSWKTTAIQVACATCIPQPASCNMQTATLKRISTVFDYTPLQAGTPGLAIRAAGSVYNN